jgi:hypothetical protein
MSNYVDFTREQFLAQSLVQIDSSSPDFKASLNNPLFVSSTSSSDGGTCNEQNIIDTICDYISFNLINTLNNVEYKVGSLQSTVSTESGTIQSALSTAISNLNLSVDLGTMPNDITATKAIIEANLDRKISSINLDGLDIDSLTFISLNGASGSFPDGTNVVVSGHIGTFVVVASQMLKNDEHQYMVVYKVQKDGKNFLVPSSMISLPEGAEV